VAANVDEACLYDAICDTERSLSSDRGTDIEDHEYFIVGQTVSLQTL